MLRSEILAAKAKKEILLMTHLVLGYPSLEVNGEVIEAMVDGGVDLIELQIPFSEPVADGPVISRACHEAIAGGVRVDECLEFAEQVCESYDIPFLFMTYCNIIHHYGPESFFRDARYSGIRGLIVPDLPPEEGEEYLALARKHEIAPVQIFAPTSSAGRMRELASAADGFIYCAARRGVTGTKTDFGDEFDAYLKRCREATDLPLAVGFGIRSREDVKSITGRADIAVIGTRTIELVKERGPAAVAPFMQKLR